MEQHISKYLLSLLITSLTIFISCSKEVSTTEPITQQTNGAIVIGSNPQGAKIFFNNTNTGKVTPDSILTLDAGNYVITLKSNDFPDTTFNVKLAASQKQKVFCDFTTNPRNFGTIECVSTPANAEIFMNDVSTGKATPYTFQLLKVGAYKVTYKFSQHMDKSESVSLTSGTIKKVELALQDTSVWVDYNPDNSNFPDFNATCIVADAKSTLWIGTQSKGVIKYTGANNYTVYNYSNSPLKDSEVKKLKVDSKGRLWILCPFSVAIFDNGNWTIFNTASAGVEMEYLTDFDFDSKGNVWVLHGAASVVGDKAGVLKYDGQSWTKFVDIPRVSWSLGIDNKDMIWISTRFGLMKFDDRTNIIWDYDSRTIKYSIFPQSNIKGFINKDDKMYIYARKASGTGGSTGGLFYYDGNSFFEIPVTEISFSSLYISIQNVMWITLGSQNVPVGFGGVIKINNSISKYYLRTDGTCPLGAFSGVTEKSNDIWFTSYESGLIKFKNGNK